MIILVLNCGSSSIKYQLFAMPDDRVICSGLVERIGESGSPELDQTQVPEPLRDRPSVAVDQRPAYEQDVAGDPLACKFDLVDADHARMTSCLYTMSMIVTIQIIKSDREEPVGNQFPICR